MAFMIRSVICRVVNESDKELVYDKDEIAHGSYDTPVPKSVPASSTAEWKSSTVGFMTGTEGYVSFTVSGTKGTFVVNWDNPFIGDNTFSQHCTGLPEYTELNPAGQNPETGETLSPEDLRDNDDVKVIYTFSTTPKPAPEQSCEFPKDQPANNQDPKPTEAAPGQGVIVRDAEVTTRKVVFLGMNDPQANKEAAALEAAIPKVDAKDRMAAFTAITPADAPAFHRDWGGKTNEEWVDTITTLVGGQRQSILDFIANSVNKSPVSSTSDSTKDQQFKRFEFRAFIKVLAAVEAEVRLVEADEAKGIKTVASPMKRLVLSSHHRPRSRGYWIGWLYSYNYLYIHLDEIVDIGKIFPKAMAQIEDILIGACNTGHWKSKPDPFGTWEIIPKLEPVCPNLQTVWAYEGTGPSAGAASDEFVAWEAASRKANAKEDIVKAAYKKRFPQWGGATHEGFWSVVWVRDGAHLAPRQVKK